MRGRGPLDPEQQQQQQNRRHDQDPMIRQELHDNPAAPLQQQQQQTTQGQEQPVQRTGFVAELSRVLFPFFFSLFPSWQANSDRHDQEPAAAAADPAAGEAAAGFVE